MTKHGIDCIHLFCTSINIAVFNLWDAKQSFDLCENEFCYENYMSDARAYTEAEASDILIWVVDETFATIVN